MTTSTSPNEVSGNPSPPGVVTTGHPSRVGIEQDDNRTLRESPMSASQSHHLPRIRINPSEPRPVRMDWLEKAAAALPAGKGMHFCIALWMLVSIRRSPTVQISRNMAARVNLSRWAAADSAHRLEAAGLVKIAKLPGRSFRITLVEAGSSIPLRLEKRGA